MSSTVKSILAATNSAPRSHCPSGKLFNLAFNRSMVTFSMDENMLNKLSWSRISLSFSLSEASLEAEKASSEQTEKDLVKVSDFLEVAFRRGLLAIL